MIFDIFMMTFALYLNLTYKTIFPIYRPIIGKYTWFLLKYLGIAIHIGFGAVFFFCFFYKINLCLGIFQIFIINLYLWRVIRDFIYTARIKLKQN